MFIFKYFRVVMVMTWSPFIEGGRERWGMVGGVGEGVIVRVGDWIWEEGAGVRMGIMVRMTVRVGDRE